MNQGHFAWIIQGSNIGDRLRNLDEAARSIEQHIGVVERTGSVYETAPWGNTDQRSFYNRVLMVKTILTPEKLLESLLAIESTMGRSRSEKWEPRIIDLDILFYDELIFSSAELTIPHPHLHERRFTLLPLDELVPELIHPVLKLSVRELLNRCSDKGDVILLSDPVLAAQHLPSKNA